MRAARTLRRLASTSAGWPPPSLKLHPPVSSGGLVGMWNEFSLPHHPEEALPRLQAWLVVPRPPVCSRPAEVAGDWPTVLAEDGFGLSLPGSCGLRRSLGGLHPPRPRPLRASRTRQADHTNLLSFANNELGQISRETPGEKALFLAQVHVDVLTCGGGSSGGGWLVGHTSTWDAANPSKCSGCCLRVACSGSPAAQSLCRRLSRKSRREDKWKRVRNVSVRPPQVRLLLTLTCDGPMGGLARKRHLLASLPGCFSPRIHFSRVIGRRGKELWVSV